MSRNTKQGKQADPENLAKMSGLIFKYVREGQTLRKRILELSDILDIARLRKIQKLMSKGEHNWRAAAEYCEGWHQETTPKPQREPAGKPKGAA